MRTLKFIFLVCMMYTVNACAQDFPLTPKTPVTPSDNDMHTEVTSTVSNSTSVSNSGNTYKFTSKFQSTKRKGILDILKTELNDVQFRKNGTRYVWSNIKNGTTIFECELSNNKLKMILDKDQSAYKFTKRVRKLGDVLRIYISSHKSFNYTTASNSVGEAQIRLEQAKEELKRSLKNLERAKRNQ